MADTNVMQTQASLPSFPIRILDRFLGLLIGGVRGTGLSLSIFVVRCFNLLSLLSLIRMALSAFYQRLKKNHWSNISSVLTTGLVFIPVLIGAIVLGVGALAYTVFQMWYVLSTTMLQGWLNRSYKERERLQQDLGKISRLFQQGERRLNLYYRDWPERFKHALREAPPFPLTEAHCHEEMAYWGYLNELCEVLPYTPQREKLFFNINMIKAIWAHHQFPVQRICGELEQSQSDVYLDVAPLEICNQLNAALGALSRLSSSQDEIYERYRNSPSDELNQQLLDLNQEFLDVKALMDACMNAWSVFKVIQDEIDNSDSIDPALAESREAAKAILAVECTKLRDKIQIPLQVTPINFVATFERQMNILSERINELMRDITRRINETPVIVPDISTMVEEYPIFNELQIDHVLMDENTFVRMAFTDSDLEKINLKNAVATIHHRSKMSDFFSIISPKVKSIPVVVSKLVAGVVAHLDIFLMLYSKSYTIVVQMITAPHLLVI